MSGIDHNARSVKHSFRRKVHPLAAQLLFLICFRKDREYLIGDLEEEYLTIVLPSCTYREARWWYWKEVAKSAISSLRRSANYVFNHFTRLAIKNYQLLAACVVSIIMVNAIIDQRNHRLVTTETEFAVLVASPDKSVSHISKHGATTWKNAIRSENRVNADIVEDYGVQAPNAAAFRRSYAPSSSFAKLDVILGTTLEPIRSPKINQEDSLEHGTSNSGAGFGGGGSCVDRFGQSVAEGYASADSDIPCTTLGANTFANLLS